MTTTFEFTFRDYVEAVRRQWRLLALVFCGVLTFAVALAVILPAVYESRAIILIEQQEIPSDLVRSTVTSFAAQRIQIISQQVMTTQNLTRIVETYDLYPELREREPQEVVLERLRDEINRRMISADVVDPRSGRPTEATIAFSLSYESENPKTARQVVNELVSLYLNENIKSRTEAATQTTSFLADEAANLGEKVAEIEAKLADFKNRNVNNRPELEKVLRDNLNRAEIELTEVRRQIDSKEQLRIYLEAELAEHEPTKHIESLAQQRAAERLALLESELAAAEASYGEQHPDVVRLRRQSDAVRAEVDPAAARKIYEDELRAARTALRALADRYEPGHPELARSERRVERFETKLASLPVVEELKPNNPAYILLQSRQEGTRAELQTLYQRRTELSEKLDEINGDLARIPDVEAEYRALTREYEATTRKYQEIASKQMEARLSQNLESERKGERFTLIEPPLLPEKPSKPNRMAILLVGLFMALGSAVGSVAVSTMLDTRVRGRRGIQQLLTAPPLASIPYVTGEDEEAAAIPWSVLAGGAAAIMLMLGGLHFLYKPLDVLWFVIQRKLGF